MDMMMMDGHGEGKARSQQPCAACRMLRRRCESNCLLAPYFPTHDLHKFLGVHKVFGASNLIKMIQMVEETKREDAVKGIVYEAMARLRDPVYGSAGSIFRLQQLILQLKADLQSITSQVSELRDQKDHLLSIIHNNNNNNDDASILFDGCCTSSFSVDDLDQLITPFDSFLEFQVSPQDGDTLISTNTNNPYGVMLW